MLDEFQADLNALNSLQLIRKYIFSGPCFALSVDQAYRLQEEIADHFSIEFLDVVFVGSGKLGFSVKPEKRYVAFGEESDIDVAVVSTPLFEKVWREAFLYKQSGADWPKGGQFFNYLARGWIRPDKLPRSEYFQFTGEWWDFFDRITFSRQYGPYKIRAGIYHSMFFLQEYQKICIEQCMEDRA